MLEAEARIDGIPGVWQDGRFVEEWIAPARRDELASAFGSYERADLGRAVLAMFAGFHRAAGSVAGVLGTSYPTANDTALHEWCRATLTDGRH